jgi:hypothetical protein
MYIFRIDIQFAPQTLRPALGNIVYECGGGAINNSDSGNVDGIDQYLR